MSETITGQNKFDQYLSLELAEDRREFYRSTTEWIAFIGLITELGRRKDEGVDLVHGITTISIPQFFAQPNFNNPVNEAALSMLPTITYESSYNNSVDERVNNHDLRGMTEFVYLDITNAARKGDVGSFVVAEKLGLNLKENHKPLAAILIFDNSRWRLDGGSEARARSGFFDGYETKRDLDSLAQDMAIDLRDGIVGEVKDVAAMVESKGFVDFLDYLEYSQAIIRERVDLVFSHPANNPSLPSNL